MLIVILWLHLVAAVAWIGGMLFLTLVAVPVLKPRTADSEQADLFRVMARRFRVFVWAAILVLITTGPLLLVSHGWSPFEPSRWPSAIRIKMSLVSLLLVLTGAHDLVIGPRVGRLVRMPIDQRSPCDRRLIAATPWLARGSLLVALAVLAVALSIARS